MLHCNAQTVLGVTRSLDCLASDRTAPRCAGWTGRTTMVAKWSGASSSRSCGGFCPRLAHAHAHAPAPAPAHGRARDHDLSPCPSRAHAPSRSLDLCLGPDHDHDHDPDPDPGRDLCLGLGHDLDPGLDPGLSLAPFHALGSRTPFAASRRRLGLDCDLWKNGIVTICALKQKMKKQGPTKPVVPNRCLRVLGNTVFFLIMKSQQTFIPQKYEHQPTLSCLLNKLLN